jgi:hypothetical protein
MSDAAPGSASQWRPYEAGLISGGDELGAVTRERLR